MVLRAHRKCLIKVLLRQTGHQFNLSLDVLYEPETGLPTCHVALFPVAELVLIG